MKIANLIIRVLLALTMAAHGIQKFVVRETPKEPFRELGMEEAFITFYTLMERSGYMLFVGVLQVLIAGLFMFRRTHLLAAISLIPMLVFLVGTHVFLSRHIGYIVFDTALLALCSFFIVQYYTRLKAILV